MPRFRAQGWSFWFVPGMSWLVLSLLLSGGCSQEPTPNSEQAATPAGSHQATTPPPAKVEPGVAVALQTQPEKDKGQVVGI